MFLRSKADKVIFSLAVSFSLQSTRIWQIFAVISFMHFGNTGTVFCRFVLNVSQIVRCRRRW